MWNYSVTKALQRPVHESPFMILFGDQIHFIPLLSLQVCIDPLTQMNSSFRTVLELSPTALAPSNPFPLSLISGYVFHTQAWHPLSRDAWNCGWIQVSNLSGWIQGDYLWKSSSLLFQSPTFSSAANQLFSVWDSLPDPLQLSDQVEII